ncbi:hypothetical protein KCU64_g4819, partial [Aureobasidium melanogenum]
MNQEEPSFTAASDVPYPNTALQAGDPVRESTPSSSQSNGPPPKKRAPLASVACQDCRRRKTKCDGKKPSCSNCTKRNVPTCTYDLEPNQSRVAAYKQKIEQQISSIKKLEEEIEVLKKSPFHSGGAVVRTQVSEPTPSSSNNSSGGVPMQLLLNPAPEPNGISSGQMSSSNTLAPYLSAPPPPVQTVNREAELLYYQRNLEIEVRKLQDENRTLRTLISLLNSIDDRDTAQNMAKEIHTHGVSDDLLSRAQHLVASQVWSSSLPNLLNQAKLQAQRPPGRTAENSWSVP